VLLGQTVNSYHDGTNDFADLLRAVGRVDGIRRLRFTSPHPNDFSDRVIAAMAEVDAVCEHVHLPMQSGSTRILKRMLRRYTREGYIECVQRLRAAIPGLSVTTDIIVGFPGETDEDFAETLAVVNEVGIVEGFTFKFSARDGTPATKMPPELTVPDEVASARLQTLVDTMRANSRAANIGQLGRRCEVLVEKEARRGGDLVQTRTRDFKTVLVPGDASMIGQYLNVELTGTTGSTFTGQVVAAVSERRPLPMALPMAG
jgi:tRNA-2-methylthio-N6-dimethylallyladenosine synthase